MLAKAKGNISTIAMYFVMPELNGKGIGTAIFTKLTEASIREGRNIGLNAGILCYLKQSVCPIKRPIS